MQIRMLWILMLATLALVLGGCGVVTPSSMESSQQGALVESSLGEIPTVAIPVGVGTVITNIPNPVPSAAVGPTATVTRQYGIPVGDMPEAQAIVDSWKQEVNDLQWLKVRQRFMQVNLDGSREILPESDTSSIVAIEEHFDFTRRELSVARFRSEAFTRQNRITAFFDGEKDCILWSQLEGELFCSPVKEGRGSNIWGDAQGYVSYLWFLAPGNREYIFEGHRVIDDRPVAELRITDAAGNGWLANARIFIDETSYLPYKITIPATEYASEYEIIVEEIEVNQPISEAEMREGLPDSHSVVTIYDRNEANVLPKYTSLYDESLDPGFTMFELEGGVQGEVVTGSIVERNGTQSPILVTELGSVQQGLYLPEIGSYVRRGLTFSDKLQKPTGTPIEIDGQPATLHTKNDWGDGWDHGVRLRLQREGTWIEVSAKTEEEAIAKARKLRPVQR